MQEIATVEMVLVGFYTELSDELSPGRLASLLNKLNTLSVVYERGFEWK